MNVKKVERKNLRDGAQARRVAAEEELNKRALGAQQACRSGKERTRSDASTELNSLGVLPTPDVPAGNSSLKGEVERLFQANTYRRHVRKAYRPYTFEELRSRLPTPDRLPQQFIADRGLETSSHPLKNWFASLSGSTDAGAGRPDQPPGEYADRSAADTGSQQQGGAK